MNRVASQVCLGLMGLLAIRAASFAQGHVITSIAGAGPDQMPALLYSLGSVRSVAADHQGNLYISSYDHNRIFKVDGQGLLTTAAGNGGGGSSGDGGPAPEATLNQPAGVAVDAAGNLYFVDGADRVRRVDALTRTITTVAGGSYGFFGDGGPATQAGLRGPLGLALNGSGDLFIADYENARIRKVDAASGIITTVAGNGAVGFNGDGIPATAASLFYPAGVAVDAEGNLLVADTRNHRVRRVDRATGLISTFAGNGGEFSGGDGSLAIYAGIATPVNVAPDAAGNVYISDISGHRVRVVSPAGIINTAAGTGTLASNGDGGPATAASLVPNGIATDSVGNLFVADEFGRRVRMVEAATGLIRSVAGNGEIAGLGDGGPALAAVLGEPAVLALTPGGDLLVADRQVNRVRRIDRASGIITTVAGKGPGPSSGDGGPATDADFNGPTGLAVDAADNIFVIDQGVNTIRRIDAGTGIITTVAGSGVFGACGDERPALEACFGYPTGMAMDGAGNVYVADTFNNRVARLDAGMAVVRTIAGNGVAGYGGDGGPGLQASLWFPLGIAVDGPGRFVYIADTSNYRVRRLDTSTGVIDTIAGNGSEYADFQDRVPATSVGIGLPRGVSLDPEGNLLVVDVFGRIARVALSTGLLHRIVGTGAMGFAGDGGPASLAVFNLPTAAVADVAGNLFIADTGNHRIRHVANDAPIANAGPDQIVAVGAATITLDGNSSSDDDLDPLRFEWRNVDGAVLGTTATVGIPAWAGTREYTLEVADGWGGRGQDTVSVSMPAVLTLEQLSDRRTAWRIGSVQRIRWTHNLGPDSHVRVELSRDAGMSWELLAEAVANTGSDKGSFDWTVTGPRTSRAVVRVSARGGSDTTESLFRIR
jgi:trimeric autotransporter adhesin